MQPEVRNKLLELNRQFYQTVAPHFNQTRMSEWPGLIQLLEGLPQSDDKNPRALIDIGCGNGRLAWLLERLETPWLYFGVDADKQLLEFGREHTAQLNFVQPHFATIDLAQRNWIASSQLPQPHFDCVACLATMHHLPSYALRRQALAEMASLLKPDGQLIVSFWQFLTSERLVKRQISWDTVGLTQEDIEPRDILLPWKQGAFAIRYAHQVDEAELERLIYDTGLTLIEKFWADGHTNNLNLYARLKVE